MLLGCDLVTGQLGLWALGTGQSKKNNSRSLGRDVGLLPVSLTLKK